MTHQPIRVQHTVTRLNEPLACFANLPGSGAELRPCELRALAAVLLRAADDCEALSKRPSKYGPARREYPLQQVAATLPPPKPGSRLAGT